MKLRRHYVEKPWGQRPLPDAFDDGSGRQIGEIWFDDDGTTLPLLVKYLFTSEKLSIQVHPSDEQAPALGAPGGKEECWYVIAAEPGATIGVGTHAVIPPEALRAAALSGEIEQMMDWKPVQAGDFFYLKAGTVHAIGAGISLIEVQQNTDITYRLYDYGRPRELHLEESVKVADARPFPADQHSHIDRATDCAAPASMMCPIARRYGWCRSKGRCASARMPVASAIAFTPRTCTTSTHRPTRACWLPGKAHDHSSRDFVRRFRHAPVAPFD